MKIKDKNTIEHQFGEILRQLRTQNKLSQEELGFESGYHRTYISLLERGKKSPSLNTIFKLADALNIKPSELIELIQSSIETIKK